MRKRLNELEPGESGTIVDILPGPLSLRRRLMDMGLVRNSKVEVLRNAPLGDPVEIKVLNYFLSLKKDEAKYIVVEVNK